MDSNLYPVYKDNKAGFINENGKIVIDFEFNNAWPFYEGLAGVAYNHKIGFVDVQGNFKVPPIYERATFFQDGLCVVMKDRLKTYINKYGESVFEHSFYDANNFEDGIAFVKDTISSPPRFIDLNGNTILTGYDVSLSNSHYREGFINLENENGKWGFADKYGNFLIKPVYFLTYPFSEGLAAVMNGKNQYGFVNKTGELVIPHKFKGAVMEFHNGRCPVWNKGYGYIDIEGKLVIKNDFYLGEQFSENLASVQTKGRNRKYGYIDLYGNVIIEPKFNIAEPFRNNLAMVTIVKNDEHYYGYIDKTGEYVWEPSK